MVLHEVITFVVIVFIIRCTVTVIHCDSITTCFGYKAVFPKLNDNPCLLQTQKADSLLECTKILFNDNGEALSYNHDSKMCTTYCKRFRILEKTVLKSQTLFYNKNPTQGRCRSGFYEYYSQCLHLSADTATWQDALQDCHNREAHLAFITNDEDNYLIETFLDDQVFGKYTWIGGNDNVTEGIWTWEFDTKIVNFTNWYPGEPNNVNGNENCLNLFKSNIPGSLTTKWNDVPCSWLIHYICQYYY